MRGPATPALLRSVKKREEEDAKRKLEELERKQEDAEREREDAIRKLEVALQNLLKVMIVTGWVLLAALKQNKPHTAFHFVTG